MSYYDYSDLKKEEHIMAKTFYSVTFAVWGSDFCRTAWFDDRAAADAFASQDYRDDPVIHTYRKSDSIRAAEARVADTRQFVPGVC